MGSGDEPPFGARVIHHGEDELLIDHDSVNDGEITSPLQEWTHENNTLGRFLSDLIDVRRSGEPCFWGHSQMKCCVDPLDRLQ